MPSFTKTSLFWATGANRLNGSCDERINFLETRCPQAHEQLLRTTFVNQPLLVQPLLLSAFLQGPLGPSSIAEPLLLAARGSTKPHHLLATVHPPFRCIVLIRCSSSTVAGKITEPMDFRSKHAPFFKRVGLTEEPEVFDGCFRRPVDQCVKPRRPVEDVKKKMRVSADLQTSDQPKKLRQNQASVMESNPLTGVTLCLKPSIVGSPHRRPSTHSATELKGYLSKERAQRDSSGEADLVSLLPPHSARRPAHGGDEMPINSSCLHSGASSSSAAFDEIREHLLSRSTRFSKTA